MGQRALAGNLAFETTKVFLLLSRAARDVHEFDRNLRSIVACSSPDIALSARVNVSVACVPNQDCPRLLCRVPKAYKTIATASGAGLTFDKVGV